MTDTPLPDAIISPTPDGDVALVLGRTARRFINKHASEKVRWRKTTTLDNRAIRAVNYRALLYELAIRAMNYRALILEPGAAVAAMIYTMHEAGLLVHLHCDECDGYHAVDDEAAEHFKMTAVSGAEGVLPRHTTLQ